MFTPKYHLVLLTLSKVLNGYCSKTAMFEVKKGHRVSIDFLKTLENAGRSWFTGKYVMNNTYLEIHISTTFFEIAVGASEMDCLHACVNVPDFCRSVMTGERKVR